MTDQTVTLADLLMRMPVVLQAIELRGVAWDAEAPLTLVEPPDRLSDFQLMVEVRWLAAAFDWRTLAEEGDTALPTKTELLDRLDALEAEVTRRTAP